MRVLGGKDMKKIEITEAEARKIEAIIKSLESKIAQTRVEHGEVLNDRRDSYRNAVSSLLSQDMERWASRARALRAQLEHATIIKPDMNSNEMIVDIGDVVETKITYEGKEPMQLKFQIDGFNRIPTVMNVTFSSPIGTALRGKKVGESFTLEKSLGCPTNAEGIILGLVKAKDLELSLKEVDAKKPYTLSKHS